MFITLFNQKGGVGKTTTTINLCAGLAASGFRVLLLDLDAQANATIGSGIEESENMYNLMQKKIKVHEAILKTNYGYDIIPSDIELSNADIVLSALMKRETVLSKSLKPILDEYDYIIADCPPNLGLLSLNALVASDSIIIPVSPEFFSIKGIKALVDTFNAVKETLNDKIEIMGVLLTKFNGQRNMAKEIKAGLTEIFGDKIFKTVIRVDSQLDYSQKAREPIFNFNKKCHAYEDYLSFVQEVVEHGI